MQANEERLSEILADYQTLPEYREVKIDGVNTKSMFGDYPIHVAIVRGALEDAELLLKNGADVSVHGEFGKTPLHMAVDFGNAEMVLLLVNWGADLQAKDLTGLTPLELAEILDKNEIAALLSQAASQVGRVVTRAD